MKRTISIVVTVAILVAAVIGAGCAGIEKPPEPLEKITFGVETSILPSAVWVAENKGYFEEEGLDVEIKEFDSGLLWQQC